MASEPPGNSGLPKARGDDEIPRLRAMLETYRCDNGIPKPAFVELLVAVALQEHLDHQQENR